MLRLRDIMTTDVIAVETTTTLRDAAELLAERHVGGVPVVEGGALAGVVSATDILAFAAATPPEPAADADDEPDEADDEAWDAPAWEGEDDDPTARYFAERWAAASDEELDRRFADRGRDAAAPRDVLAAHTVGEIMTRDVLTLPPTAEVGAAARRMRDADVHRLLVVEEGALVGIVTTSDVARAVAEGRTGGRRTFVFERGRRPR